MVKMEKKEGPGEGGMTMEDKERYQSNFDYRRTKSSFGSTGPSYGWLTSRLSPTRVDLVLLWSAALTRLQVGPYQLLPRANYTHVHGTDCRWLLGDGLLLLVVFLVHYSWFFGTFVPTLIWGSIVAHCLLSRPKYRKVIEPNQLSY